ncbi:MAG: TonB-dependent receptor [Blastocatellia bacterium]
MECRSARLLLTFCVTLIVASALYAQIAVSLHGHVVDELGAIIPGARVTLRAADGKKRNAVANASGDFIIPNLPPGVYTLTVEFKGFRAYINAEVQIPTAAPLKIALTVAPVNAETDVKAETGGVSVEPDQNLSAIVLDERMIMDLLPDNEDDMRDFLQALAGPAAGGGGQFYIDGFPNGRLPPREATLQIRINQNPFSAEYARPGAGRIEIITKPGNEQWRGSLGFSLSNSAFNARRANATTRPDLDQRRYTFTLSGPLIAKKMSFFFNGENRTVNSENTINARTLNGPFIANAPSLIENRFFGLRSGYLINQKNTLNIGFNYQQSRRESNGGDFTLPERGARSDNTNQTLTISETFLISPRLIHEIRLRYQHEISDQAARTSGVAINVPDAFSGGGDPCCPNRSRQDQLAFQDYLTLSYKKHSLRGGFQFEYENNRDLSASNFNGAYTFSSLNQYRAVVNNDPSARPTQFTINRGAPFVRYKQARSSWFIQDDIRSSQSLTLSVGLRHEFQNHLQDKINFAPRFGVAWSPFRNRKTTIRTGGGVFFDRLTGNLYENTLRYDGVSQQSIVIRNPIFIPNFTPAMPDPVSGDSQVEARNNTRRVLDPKLQAPYTINFMTSVERQFSRGFIVSVTHNYLRGAHLYRTRNINASLPDTNTQPDPAQGNLYQLESSASSRYNGFSFRLDRRFSRSFSVITIYTLSWTNNDADGSQSLPANNYDLRSEWARATADRRHSLLITGPVSLKYGVYLTPFIQAHSGAPFNITTGHDDNRDTTINDRPAGIPRNSELPTILYGRLPAICVQNCGPGQTPVLLANFLAANFPNGVRAIGARSFTTNLSVSKAFRFGNRAGQAAQNRQGGQGGPGGIGNESNRFNLQFSAQIANLFNHVNPGPFTGVLTSPFFNRSNRVSPARHIEFNFRFSF